MASLLAGLPTIYINLDKRTDRRAEMEAEFGAAHLTRLSASASEKTGWLGCTMSHIRALAAGWATGASHVVILEDDAMVNPKVLDSASKAVRALCSPDHRKSWDVLLLHVTSNSMEAEVMPGVRRLKMGYATAAYIVRREYIPVLQECWRHAWHMGNKDTDVYTKWALDVAWHRLMARDRFLALSPVAVLQRPSYSDIEGKDVDYTNGTNV